MSVPYIDILEDDDHEPGIHRREFAEAVSVWAWMTGQHDPRSVAEASLTFNTTPDMIRRAIDDHAWMFRGWGVHTTEPLLQFIEHDGE
jgi:hypothetical protein